MHASYYEMRKSRSGGRLHAKDVSIAAVIVVPIAVLVESSVIPVGEISMHARNIFRMKIQVVPDNRPMQDVECLLIRGHPAAIMRNELQ
eukprot:CAMPEP_0183480386 /NCGR_PEP_ID=MMETSP0370-20130417/173211_1 /TAXON_ID=268820 /ORGANISM="Peridinium aciculiferum, Strain PAER-2" /LENGTH=88 /DNA_ID=CAMNT_0025673469 /DNA_START=150 /DNA_END=416 /DNA_ORIENTATION=-